MKRRFLNDSERSAMYKLMVKLMDELRESLILVEGKNDCASLKRVGLLNTIPISGRVKRVCELVGTNSLVVILTDLDRRGDELAVRAQEELVACGIIANVEMRKVLGRLLGVRYFEEFGTKYEKFISEVN